MTENIPVTNPESGNQQEQLVVPEEFRKYIDDCEPGTPKACAASDLIESWELGAECVSLLGLINPSQETFDAMPENERAVLERFKTTYESKLRMTEQRTVLIQERRRTESAKTPGYAIAATTFEALMNELSRNNPIKQPDGQHDVEIIKRNSRRITAEAKLMLNDRLNSKSHIKIS